MNERLLTDEEVIAIRIKYWTGWNDDNDSMKQILLAQDAKTLKWIASQKEAIASIVMDNLSCKAICAYWDTDASACYFQGCSGVNAPCFKTTAIISLLTQEASK